MKKGEGRGGGGYKCMLVVECAGENYTLDVMFIGLKYIMK